MVRVTGTLEIKIGYIRVKPNVPFIGSLSGVSVYEINDGLIDIQLAPTPNDRVYLVDYALSPDAAFLPTENWIVPDYDCELDEVRGLVVYKQNLQLQLDNNQLRLNNNQLQLQTEQLTLNNNQLQLDNNQLRLNNNQLQLQTEQLTLNNNQLQLDNNQLQLKIESLKLENSDLKQQIERLALHNPDASEKNTLNSSSINILKRFL